MILSQEGHFEFATPLWVWHCLLDPVCAEVAMLLRDALHQPPCLLGIIQGRHDQSSSDRISIKNASGLRRFPEWSRLTTNRNKETRTMRTGPLGECTGHRHCIPTYQSRTGSERLVDEFKICCWPTTATVAPELKRTEIVASSSSARVRAGIVSTSAGQGAEPTATTIVPINHYANHTEYGAQISTCTPYAWI